MPSTSLVINNVGARRTLQQVAPFNQQTAAPFINKSISEETRRLYRRVIRDFFAFVGSKSETQVTQGDVLGWRDRLLRDGRRASTVALKLSVLRSFFEYLRAYGRITLNPASTRLVPPPPVADDPAGRALVAKEARYLLASPDRRKPAGARDHAIILIMARMSLRVSEVASLRVSSIMWSHGMSIIRFKVKGGRERKLPLPAEVKEAIHEYLRLDRSRRRIAGTDGPEAYLFQPHTNARTLVYSKPLSTRMVRKIVKRYADFAQIGHVSPHDLRRTAITRALDLGYHLREVQMMSGHKDIRSLMRYDRGRENLEKNPVNKLHYDD
jgi:integrase/recombinase XerD